MYSLVNRLHFNRFTFFSAFVLGYLLVFVFISGTSKYSPDSWSYFELAKKFYSEDFYKFNTYRSYFSDDRSASFPFGFPALLAVINEIFGWNPLNAAYLNVVLAFSSFLLIQSISLQFGFPKIAGLALATSFLFYPGFLNEIASGRSYPAAATLILLGLYLVLISRKNWQLLIGGSLIGASVLVRFDFLFTAWISMMLLMWYQKKCLIPTAITNIGFIIGIMPWIIYSLIFFSKPWISDNSWVAISAAPAYVLDFPAHADDTLFTNPLSWTKKLIINGGMVFVSLTRSIQGQPLLLLLLAHSFFILFSEKPNYHSVKKTQIIIAVSGIFIMLTPYLLTGYTDSRYFSFFFLVSSIIILAVSSQKKFPVNFTFTASIFIMIFMGTTELVPTAGSSYRAMSAAKEHNYAIEKIADCHQAELDHTYIFIEEARRIAFQYGALTGNKVAILPSNFDNLDQESYKAFLQTITPYRLFRSLQIESCENSDSLDWRSGDSK